ncbi:MAG: ABC transporter permease [Phycisphaeraceae bacterium]|nr:ABC transporter permease [Phycisphaeraceae bacterium]
MQASRLTVIGPRRGMAALDLAGVWRYRELWWTLAVRDLQIRYKQTLLGVAWAVIVPVVTMLVLHVFFGKVMGLAARMDGVAYPVFLFAGNLPWLLFSNTLNYSSNSLVNNSHILSKVYFPRLILPLSAAAGPVADYLIAFVVLLGMCVWFEVALTWRLMMLAPLLVLLMAAALGLSVLLAAVMVSYRDVRHVIPFLTQVLFFVTPVIYPLSFVPERYQWLMYLNPLCGIIEAMRAVTLGGAINVEGLTTSGGAAVLLLIVGVLWFGAAERKFADVI